MSNNGILETSIFNLKESAKRLNLDEAILNRLLEPKEKIEITLNPALSDERIIHTRAFIVRHCDAIGPSKGGIRMLCDVSLDDITGLAMEMTWKTALIGVPFGGGKSGICFGPQKLSSEDKERVLRAFTRGAKKYIGPEVYVPAPDMGTNEEDMGHISDCISYSAGTSITSGCFVTGKPVILGGIMGRKEATGKGVVYTVLAACEKLGIDITDAKIVVQGFGNVGSVAARVIAEAGAKIIAVSEIHEGIFNPDGIDIDKLLEYARGNGTLKGFAGSDAITNKELLELECDILMPSACQSQINERNAANVKARIIAEGANAPTTPKADEMLNEKGVFIIPDILCNAGGVFVSYLEYTQETQREQMDIEHVERRLQERMQKKFRVIYEYSQSNNVTMRQASMDIAVSTVANAVKARGFLP